MDVDATLDLLCTPDALRVWIDDLDRYPAWLSIVPRADREPAPDDGTDPGEIGAPAWAVELRAHLGPLARSKRLRMVRTLDEPMRIRFERWELDGRDHSPWILDVRMEPTAATVGDGPDQARPAQAPVTTRLVMALHYGGNFGSGLLEKLLRDEIERSKPRLRELVEPPPSRP